MNKELKEYLLYIGRKAGSEVKLNYILGNTSGDLDSVVSAISYSKLLNAVNLPVNFESDVNKKKYGKHIPILNFNKESIRLKFALIELIDYFSEKVEGEPINIVEFPFIFFNDIKTNLIDKTKIKRMSGLNDSFNEGPFITLVDHNVLDNSQKILENNVVCIVDHHEDDNTTRSIFRLSKGTRIGSCSTLIGKLWMDYYNDGKLSDEDLSTNKYYLLMLIGAILKDTSNFDKSLFDKRWCLLDSQICDWLCKKTNVSNEDCIDLYKNRLENSNRNAALLFENDMTDLLNMDYKLFSYKSDTFNVGYSSFEINLTSIINYYKNDKFYEKITNYMISKNLNMYLLLSTFVLGIDSDISYFSQLEKATYGNILTDRNREGPALIKQMMIFSRKHCVFYETLNGISKILSLKEINRHPTSQGRN